MLWCADVVATFTVIYLFLSLPFISQPTNNQGCAISELNALVAITLSHLFGVPNI